MITMFGSACGGRVRLARCCATAEDETTPRSSKRHPTSKYRFGLDIIASELVASYTTSLHPDELFMRQLTTVTRVAAAVFLAASLAAQTVPDFSGRWTLAPDAPATPTERGGRTASGTMGSGWGSDITVRQDATTLTIEYAPFARSDMQPPIKLVYLLNGSESRNTINMGRGPQEQRSTVALDGSKIVITTLHSFRAAHSGETMTSETRHVLSLESPTLLMVETTRSEVMGGQLSTTKTAYRKN
jgi:hypothetical protein